MRDTRPFRLVSDHQPTGDQPQAIETLLQGLERGDKHQVLLGITGSGKTFSVANVIARSGRPTLILAPNKTLAAQLYGEMKRLFPENAVEYFVSYYDYYQPEAYVPSSDTYIEKDSLINEAIDRLRHAATKSLLERNDVIIVASVSCIYGLGSSEAYQGMLLYSGDGAGDSPSGHPAEAGRDPVRAERAGLPPRDLPRARGRDRHLPGLRGRHRHPNRAVRRRGRCHQHVRPAPGQEDRGPEQGRDLPGQPLRHAERQDGSGRSTAIQAELIERLEVLSNQNKLLEAQRLEQRTYFDLEMMQEIGRCKGIENYSRHLSGRAPGEPPPTLIEYFPQDWLLIVDESHIAVPQVGGMYRGDRARKEVLVDFGFRLPSALDNRPLKFDEFQGHVQQAIYVSATPGNWELEKSDGKIVEQIIRPTGLLDPTVEVRPAQIQVDDALHEIRDRVAKSERVLVTVLTKRMAQELTDYWLELGVRCRYLHSDIDTIERMEILRELRVGEFDVLVGINLLREGLDLPEVSLVCVMDADKEGFLRNERSLIQTMGRAARNVNGHVILYADRVTENMEKAIGETRRRRMVQQAYNEEHGITPRTIRRDMENPLAALVSGDYVDIDPNPGRAKAGKPARDAEVERKDAPKVVAKLRKEMRAAAAKLEFERAAELRDRIHDLEAWMLEAPI